MLENSERASRAITLIWISIAVSVANLIASSFEYLLLDRINEGNYTTDEAEFSDTMQGVVGLLVIVVLIINMYTFLSWYRQFE